MAENSTLARPYAKAVFELAKGQATYDRWSKVLATLSALSADAGVKALLNSPRAMPVQRAEVLAELSEIGRASWMERV